MDGVDPYVLLYLLEELWRQMKITGTILFGIGYLLFPAAMAVAFCGIVAWVVLLLFKPRKKTRPKFNTEQAKVMEEHITDGLEVCKIMGLMSARKAKHWATFFADRGLEGLRPRRVWKMLHPFKAAALKAAIKKRMEDKENRPVSLPPYVKADAKKTRGNLLQFLQRTAA